MRRNTWCTYLYQQLTNHKTKLKFFVVGCVGFFCNALVLFLATSLGLHRIPAEVISMLISLQVTFLLHDKWTYEGVDYARKLRRRYALYLASNSFGSVMTIVIFSLLSLVLSNFVSLAIASVSVMVWNYMMNKIVIWRNN